MKYIVSAFITFFLVAAAPLAQAFEGTYYLVRHAEKQQSGIVDPALTDDGERRAVAIAQKLAGVHFKVVYSTHYIRSIMTAQPTVLQSGAPLVLYDYSGKPEDAAAFAKDLKQQEGNYLIVGHRNTIPMLASALSGEDIKELEEHEYDRLYMVSVGNDGKGKLSIIYTDPRTP